MMRLALPVVALLGLLLLTPGLKAQSVITGVDPPNGKAGDVITASGEAIDQGKVDALYLTDGKNDVQVEMSEQTEKAIKFKIPAGTKPGRWALMIRTKGSDPKLLEMPVKLTVE